MWAGWEDVANQPQDEAARGQVLKRLETLVGGIHFSQDSLGAQWTQSRESLDVLVADVNSAAANIADAQQGDPAREPEPDCRPTTSPTSATSWS